MTLAEKIGQMTQIDRSVASFDVIRDLSIGSVLNGGDSAPSPDWTPSMWADMVDGYQRAALSSRLGIPMIYGTDAVHGHNNVFGSTVFPHNIGLGATRDADLVLRIGKATALEIRGTGIPYAFAPCLAYLLYGPLVAKALHSWVYEDGQRYSWCLHILIICALRGLIYQLWHSYGSMLFLTRNRMVNKQGVGYKQIDEEWDCSNANPPFWIPIHIVNPERPTECAIFNVIADSPRDSVQFMEWSPAPCPRALLIANFHGRITIWTQPSLGPVNLVRDASCWHCEHEWRQDLAVVTKWLAGMYPRHFVYTVMALLTCFVSMHLVCCVCQEQVGVGVGVRLTFCPPVLGFIVFGEMRVDLVEAALPLGVSMYWCLIGKRRELRPVPKTSDVRPVPKTFFVFPKTLISEISLPQNPNLHREEEEEAIDISFRPDRGLKLPAASRFQT
ncbi:lysosomal beta glucosidase-like protein [Cinnamomum micranthum f. kanehirae]|uniref:Lysosomal beta glucosidase-like protein n=1 Tax=Cinnamomum micranthum f. kanehirae TaxID=337451 RepID=A0A3S4NS56_9MAGN|nr:lysosomal beta glucosidase-like protein [Cinnamomum micranthum f. kanehirae]